MNEHAPFQPKARILFVDDEFRCSRMLEVAFPRYEIRIENHPSRAIETAIEFQPDLIFLDRIMPDLAGDTLSLAIKAHPKLQNVPIIFLTAAVPRESNGRPHTQLNGCPVLSKPISNLALEKCIRRFVNR